MARHTSKDYPTDNLAEFRMVSKLASRQDYVKRGGYERR